MTNSSLTQRGADAPIPTRPAEPAAPQAGKITPEFLRTLGSKVPMAKLQEYAPLLEGAMLKYGITEPVVQAMFLANVMHESGGLFYLEELASGEAYDTGSLAKRLGNTPEKDGDGQRYKGRGWIQLTGTDNYRQFSQYTGVDFLKEPLLLREPKWAAVSATWFWNSRRLTDIARKGDRASFDLVVRRINGGTNGMADRLQYWEKAKTLLGIK